MGADRVEVISDKKQLTKETLAYCDYVVVEDVKEDELPDGEERSKFVSFKWVKECLICGQKLPRPQGTDGDEEADDDEDESS